MGTTKFYVVFLAALFLLPLHFNVKAQSLNADTIIYVKAAGAGSMDGSSWDNAMASLSDALDSAYNWNQENRTITSIWVAEGTYYGNTDNYNAAFEAVPFVNVYGGFVGNEPANYDLSQRNFTAHPTILDGQHSKRVLYANHHDWEDNSLVGIWDGFTIQNGFAGNWENGSGVYIYGNFILSNCIIKNNGIESQGYYGGVFLDYGTMRNCQVYNNKAHEGGGVAAFDAHIENSLIANNIADEAQGFTGYSCQVINCNIVNNQSTNAGYRISGGVNLEGEDMESMRSHFENCIIWGNTYAGTPCQISGESGLFYHCAIEGEVVHGSDNIILSPALCGDLFSPCFADTSLAAIPYGYALQQNSICINRGNNNAVSDINKDMVGQNRIRHSVVDMGCFESDYDAVQIPPFNGNIVYVAAGGRGTQSGQDWSNAMASLRQASITANLHHIPQIWVAGGLYEPAADETGDAAFYMMPGINVYGGLVGNEPANYDLSQRNFEAYPTILSGAHRMRVLEQAGEFTSDKAATWSGFTIRHGLATSSGAGAKLYNNGNLEYCIIDSNYIEVVYSNCNGGAVCINQPLYWIPDDATIDMSRSSHIDHCIIKDNFIEGGQYYAMFARNAIISNTLIANNHSSYGGQAVGLQNSQIINCDVVNNIDPDNWGSEISGNDDCEVTNSIVWDNSDIYDIVSSDVIVNFSAILGGHSGNGNINLNMINEGTDASATYPRFLDPENGDYHLLWDSPCIDAGSNSATFGTTDLAGHSRVYNNTVDMGCYEYSGEQYCLAPSRPVVDALTDNSVHISWTNRNQSEGLGYIVRYREEGVDTWTNINSTTTATFINNLTTNTTYYVQVQGFCSATDSTEFSSTLEFTTLCASNGNDVIVGNGTMENSFYPIYTGNRYSIGQFIYTADELGNEPIYIDRIAFQYVNNNPKTRYIYLKLGHTSRNSYSAYTDLFPQDSVEVYYAGDFRFNNTGEDHWCEILLDDPFQYDGEHNLIVSLRDQTGSSSSGYNFLCHNTSDNMSIGFYRNSSPYLGLFNAVQYGTPVFDKTRPNIRVPGPCDGSGCPIPNYLISNITDNSVNIEWPNSLIGEQTEVQYKRSTDTGWTTQSMIYHPQPIINLIPNMEYNIRVRTRCSATEFSAWNEQTFTTSPKLLDVIYVTVNGSGLRDGSSWLNAANDLQWAIDQANSLHENYGLHSKIYVAEGTYQSTINDAQNAFLIKPGMSVYGGFAGNEPENFNVADRDIAAHPTILDGQYEKRVLFQNQYAYDEDSTLWDGFIITRGRASTASGTGCYIAGNTTLRNCIIRDCGITTESCNAKGTVLYAYSGPTIENCEISDNVCPWNEYGNLIYFNYANVNNIVVKNNYFKNILISAEYSNISNSLFANNTHNTFFYLDLFSKVINSTIANNKNIGTLAFYRSSSSYYWDEDSTFINCIFWHNMKDEYHNDILEKTYNCAIDYEIRDNENIVISPYNNDYYGPKFANPSTVSGYDDSGFIADWHLQDSSFCINRGNNNYAYGSKDMDGSPRIQQGGIDLGCYESNHAKYEFPAFENNAIYVTESGSGERTGIDWDNALSDLQMALYLSYFNRISDVKVAEGTYSGDSTELYISNGTHLIGGFVGDSLPAGHYSTLDGQSRHAVIMTRYAYYAYENPDIDKIHLNNLIITNSGLRYNENTSTSLNTTYLTYSDVNNCIFRNNAIENRPNINLMPIVRGFGNISNCTIEGNGTTALEWVGKVEKTIIKNNQDLIWSNDSIIFYNCQFLNNKSSHSRSSYNYSDNYNYDKYRFYNCLIANNEGPLGGLFEGKYFNCDIVCNKITANQLVPIFGKFYNSIIWGNRNAHGCEILNPSCEVNYSAVEGGFSGESNITLSSSNENGPFAPHFIMPNNVCGNTIIAGGDWRLQSDSSNCCINTGNNDYCSTPLDLDDSTRIYAGIIDRGCYESRITDTFNFPVYHGIVYVSQNGTGDGSSWQNALSDLQYAINLAQTMNADVWVAAGIYSSNDPITLSIEDQLNDISPSAFYAKDGVNVYGGFAGNEPSDFDLDNRDWQGNRTILDGQNQSRILGQNNDFQANPYTTWSGFIFRNGKTYGNGAAVYLRNRFCIEKSIFEDNTALDYHAGNYNYSSYGGAIFVNDYDTIRLKECEFRNNTATYGGAIYGRTTAFIDRCNIHHNTASSNGAFLISNQGSHIRNSIIANNQSENTILTFFGSMANCDILNNELTNLIRNYNHIYENIISINNYHYINNSYYSIDDTAMVNCIFWGNHGDSTVNQHDFNTSFLNQLYCLYQNCAFENAVPSENFINLAHENSGYTDTIQYVDFVNPNEGDYHLCRHSVCIDRGAITEDAGSIDFSGNQRINHNKIDIGALEYADSCQHEPAIYNKIYYVTVYGSGDGSSWNNATGDLQAAIDSAHLNYLATGEMSMIWVARGTYYGSDIHKEAAFTLREGASIYGSFNGNEPADYDLDERNFMATPSILDGAERQRALMQPVSLTETAPCIVDGFILQHGHTTGNGGGAYLGAHTQMYHCTVRNNIAQGKGGGVYGLNGQYANCLFTNNESGNEGGGVYADNVVFVNCDIVKNKSGNEGAGIYSVFTSLLTNCVLWNNVYNNANSSYAGRQCILYSAIEGGCPGESNITLAHNNNGRGQFHPNFVKPATVIGIDTSIFGFNYALTDSSVLMNRGNNMAAEGFNTDIYGQQRIQEGTIDIGCYESTFDTIIPILASTDTIYVKAGGAGNYSGQSWDNACASLCDALTMASLRDQRTTIWVAKGTYYGEQDFENAFTIPAHTDVYGGFAGNEPGNYDLSLRNFDVNECILSGNNCQRVLFQADTFSNEDAVIWDGFTISNGNIITNGAGAYIQDNFTLQNCEISENYTIGNGYGGGIYAEATLNGRCIIKNCYIHNNACQGAAGGLYAKNAIIDSCTIAENTSNSTGGLYALSSHVQDCTIEENIASQMAGVYSIGSTFDRCQIVRNIANYSAGGFTSAYNTRISNCLIANNTGIPGGVKVARDQDFTMINCDVVNNNSPHTVAGFINDFIYFSQYSGGRIYLYNCIFWGNKTNYLPDLFSTNNYSYFYISHCAFEGVDIEGNENINLSSYNDGFSLSQNYVRFNDPSHDNFTLHQSSICIDRGDASVVSDSLDLVHHTRIKGFDVEMGCYEVEVDSSCLPVTNVEVLDVQSAEVTLSWHPEGSESEWTILIHQEEEGIDTAVVANTIPFAFTGLPHNREYTAVVKARCDSSTTSVNSLPVYFFTTCDTASLTPIPDFANMRPADSTLIYYTHVDFYWEAMPEASSYNLYLWPADEPMPSNPQFFGLTNAWLENIALDTLFYGVWDYGKEFYWKVEAVNECISRESPIHNFQIDYLPDLHVTALSHSAATASQPMTVQWTVRNDGLGHTPPGERWSDYIWLSSNDQVLGTLSQVWDNHIIGWDMGFPIFRGYPVVVDEAKLATIECPSPLAPGEEYTNSVTVTVPDTCLGTYFLYALSDQEVTSKIIDNNIRFGDNYVLPVPYTPSLNGDPYYFLHSDYQYFYTTDTFANGRFVYEPNEFVMGRFPYAINSQIFEGNDGRNFDNFFYEKLQISTPPAADFVVSHIAHPSAAFTQDTIDVNWTVSNIGNLAYEGDWIDAVYVLKVHDSTTLLNGETTIQIGDSLLRNAVCLGTFNHSGHIGPDSSLTFTEQVVIPNNTFETYTFLVNTDITDLIYESVKNDNNMSSSGHGISITMTPPPDLTVRNISFDPVASSDMDLMVNFDVVNIGAGATVEDYWEDVVLIQNGSTFFSSRFPHHGVLAPEESYHVSANVHIPNDYSGIANVSIQTDANLNVFEYLTRPNNTVHMDSSLRIVNPDLVIVGFAIRNQENMDRNHRQHIDITIANVGEGILYDKEIACSFYYDNELHHYSRNSSGSVYIKKTPRITLYPCMNEDNPYSRLPIYNSQLCTYTFETEIDFPCEDLSQHTLSVEIDYYDVAYESNENNNHSDTIEIFNAEPDLTVEDIYLINNNLGVTRIVPEENFLYTGDEITVSWSVVNVGSAPMIPDPLSDRNDTIKVVDRIYISHYPNTYADGILLGTYTHKRNLNVGESDPVYAQFTLPNGFFGNCYLHVVTNTTNIVCEGSNVTTNENHSSVFPVILRPYPDLTVTSFELPDTLIMGSTIHVNYTISNSEFATQSIAGFITDELIMYKITSNGSINSRIPLGSNYHYTNLDINDSATYSITCQIPNSSDAEGLWIFGLTTDATNDYYEYMYEDNNSKSISSVLKLYNFDLQVDTLIKLSPNPFRWGEESTVKFVFENTSHNPSLSHNCVNKIYLSQDDLFDSEDLLLETIYYNDTIQAYETIEQDFNITIPMGANEYSYLIVICNSGEFTRIPENDFNNNTFILPIHIEEVPVPDLLVSNVEILNSSIISGQEIRVAYTITNIGTSALPARSWTDKFFLSIDTVYSTTDLQIGNKACEHSLQIGESYRDTANITIPLPNSGRENLLVYVNANNGFFERNRSNNVNYRPISIRLPDPGDLIVTQINCGDTITSGQDLPMNWKVQNIGEYVLAGNGLRSLAYISADTIFDATDRLLGEVVSDNIVLPQNSMISQSLSPRVANIPEGNYYIIVKTNVSLNFYESNTQNNQTVSLRPVFVKMKALPFNTPVPDVLNNSLAEDYKLTVDGNINETVRISVQSDHTEQGAVNNIFVQHNDVANNLNYTYSTIGQNTGNSEVFIPSTQPYFYGVNVLGSTPGDTAQNITLEADILPLELININPSYGGNTGVVTIEMTGSKFRADMPVWLDNGHDTIHCRRVIFDNYYHAYAEFDLSGRDTGKYDVNILNFCDGVATLADTFHIVESVPEHLSLNLITPQAVRLHHTIILTLEFQNQGTEDIVNPIVKLSNSADCWLGLSTSSLIDNQTEVEIPLTIDGDLPNVLRPGAYGTVNIFCYTNSKIIAIIIDRVH